MLKLATLCHLNLMYSAIPAARRAEVIARCYHRVLDLAEGGVPVAVEASGLTLQMIAALDPRWVERLRGLLRSGHAEYVACGYSQIIGPLAPAGVNARNLDLGRRAAMDLLGVEPELWLVNEMAWSGGLAALYRDAGARAVIMEWNNAWHAHPEWDGRWRWHWQRAQGPDHPDGAEVPVIWVDTFDFQKMQRLCSGDITRDEFLAHWRSRLPGPDETTPRHALLYGSDAEVFDFRPGRYRDEHGGLSGQPQGEWDTFTTATGWLAAEPGMALAPLGSTLDERPSALCAQPLRLETVGQPVPVKKQEKYNLNRWAVTGRGDLELNTACHARARELSAAGEASDESWRDLLFLWSSDLRTHLTGDRWADVAPRASLPRLAPLDDDGAPSPPSPATDGDLRVRKEWLVDACAPMVTLSGVMDLPARRAAEIHPVHLTVVPGVFDAGSLGFAVRNGGRAREVFRFRDGPVHHGEAYSTLITAKGGLGATDGELVIGDDRRRLVLRHDPCVSALMPTVRFVPGADPWHVAWSLTMTAEDLGLDDNRGDDT